MTGSQSEGTATPDKLQWHVPNNKTLHKITLKPGLNLSIFQGSTPMSFKFLIYYKIILLTILEETTKELYISVDNCIAKWEIINKQIQTLDFQRDIESTQEKQVNQKLSQYINTVEPQWLKLRYLELPANLN